MPLGSDCAGNSVEIRILREADLPGALQVQQRENWNQTENDWKRLLRLSPTGCFAAFSAEDLVGSVTVVAYGKDLAWIGMLLVAQEYRRRGIGRQLMRAALNYCQSGSIATIKLDATPVGGPLYESLGFVPEGEVERWQGAGFSKVQGGSGPFRNNQLSSSCYELDDRAFYVSRRKLLDSLLEDCCVAPALQTDDSLRSPQGYALARRGARAHYVGPIVALERRMAIGLLDRVLARLPGQVFLDVWIGGSDSRSEWVRRGFVKQRAMTRMSLGRQTAAVSDLVFAIAGPELG